MKPILTKAQLIGALVLAMAIVVASTGASERSVTAYVPVLAIEFALIGKLTGAANREKQRIGFYTRPVNVAAFLTGFPVALVCAGALFAPQSDKTPVMVTVCLCVSFVGQVMYVQALESSAREPTTLV